MQDGNTFDFSQLHGRIEKAQKKTDIDLQKASDIPVANTHGGMNLPGIIDPASHGSPYSNNAGIEDKHLKDVEPFDLGIDVNPRKDKVFAFDIETYKILDLAPEYLDYKLDILRDKRAKTKEKVEEAKKDAHNKAAVNPMLGRIILTGIAVSNEPITDEWALVTDGVAYKSFTAFDGGEKEMLEKFWKEFNHYRTNGYTFASFNGKKFDLPYLIFRSLIHEIDFQGGFSPFSLLSPYRHDNHCDLMQLFPMELTGNRWLGLNEMAYLFGYKHVDFKPAGNDIAEWYENREFKTIIKKNMWDCALTLLLHRKVRNYI